MARTGAAGGAGAFGRQYDPTIASAPPPSSSFATMTVGGSVTATLVLMVLLVGAAAVGWMQVDQVVPRYNAAGQVVNGPAFPSWLIIPLLIGVGLGFVTAFKPKLARITAPLYALSYGVAIGALSAVYNGWYDGIVTQAVFATLGIFASMLFLYVTRIIKVTNKYVMVVTAATLGIFVMYLLAFVVQLFGVDVSFLSTPSPLSIGISVVIIIVAALNLGIDFAFIEKASAAGVPKYMEWYAAFGVVTTLVWIYLEVLRLLAILNRN